MTLSKNELARYQRHLTLAGFGPAGQEKLKGGSVLVIGAGGLGCPALLYLAAAGVGRIVIVDSDRVEVSNLQRQVLYTSADEGQPKAEAAAARLRALNPFITIEPIVARFTRDNALELVRSVKVVLDGSDNFGTRYLVNDACVLADRPFVYGAIQGFEGQLSVFNWQGGPTYRCLFPAPPEPGTVQNCAEAGVLGVLPGLIGTAQATEVIKLLTGIGEPLSGRLLLWDSLAMRSQTVTLAADPRSRQISELPPAGDGEVCAVPGLDGDGKEIDVAELRAALAAGREPQLVDVREDWERQMSGTIGADHHAPLSQIMSGDSSALTVLDPMRPTVVYCAAGQRSLNVARSLREQLGFRTALSLRGGMHAWQRPV
jgi:molybdopterin/thiamine biosynthesis adenylyltransferase/rhodanese-related sulfurtransferase